jgi:Na+-translocating ferredoxin:NAD+ oxidoreductase subunit D
MDNKLFVGPSPHISARGSVGTIMWMVSLSLAPAGIAGVIIFGWHALWVIAWAVAAAVGTEYALQKISHRTIALSDGSAFLTGLLIAYNVGPDVPWWIPAAGSFVAIFVGKFVFGGLGRNIFNPALVGRAFLMASWPSFMTKFSLPMRYDGIASATPLMALKELKVAEHFSYMDLFLGLRGGCIGEVCIVALLAGAVFLLARGYISWHTPLSFIAATGLFTFIFGPRGLFSGDWIFHILSGGLVLGAFFMATDYVTSPLTRTGQIVFGIGCGILTGVIRLWGGYPEGISYAILMMNAVVPLIDRYMRPRIYGTK